MFIHSFNSDLTFNLSPDLYIMQAHTVNSICYPYQQRCGGDGVVIHISFIRMAEMSLYKEDAEKTSRKYWNLLKSVFGSWWLKRCKNVYCDNFFLLLNFLLISFFPVCLVLVKEVFSAVDVCYGVSPAEQTIYELCCALRGCWTDPFIQAGGVVHAG